MQSLRRLTPYLRPYFWHLVIAVLLAIPLAAIATAPALYVQKLVDELAASETRKVANLQLYTWAIIGLFILNFPLRFGHNYLVRKVVGQVNERLKNDLYRHVQSLSSDYFTVQNTGSLISRVGSDTSLIDGGISSIGPAIAMPLKFFFALGYALYLDWKLTLVTLSVLPALAWVFTAGGRNIKRYIHRIADENARIFEALQEGFSGIRVVKLFRLEKRSQQRFEERTAAFRKTYLKIARLEEVSHPLVELVTAFAIAAVVYYGGLKVVKGQMMPGELIGFFAAFALMIDPLRTMNAIHLRLQSAGAACARVFEVFDWQSRLPQPSSPIPLTRFNDTIEFDRVRFAYPDEPTREVLRGIDFRLKRGEALALVGASGSGKSSLAALLPRLYDVTGGAIRIDGHDVKKVDRDALRDLISVVSQDVFLFNDTIAANIRCGRLDASDAEVREAARLAHALDFIEAAPGGFQAMVGERGQKLSGGEKQRISIARAFLRQAPILILDEATSSLDNHSERVVQEALEELMRGRTTLVIAHRLTTIRNCSRILVMNAGQIIEDGDFDSLMAKRGEFYRLQSAQEQPH